MGEFSLGWQNICFIRSDGLWNSSKMRLMQRKMKAKAEASVSMSSGRLVILKKGELSLVLIHPGVWSEEGGRVWIQ